jgi:hypothetical protein
LGTTITAEFQTRRDADLAVERLVQDYGVERTDVFISAAGSDNTAGTQASGADVESGHPNTEVDAAPALNGAITVSVDIEDDTKVDRVRAALNEFDPSNFDEK